MAPAAMRTAARPDADWAIHDLDAPLGARVTGIDARLPLTAAQVLAMNKALHERHALLLRGQQLDDEQFMRFCSYFGSVYHAPEGEHVLGRDPYSGATPDIVRVSNVEGGVLGRYALAPHIDHHWTQVPSAGSLAYAVEIPADGGNTNCYNLVAAWEALDAKTQREIVDLQLITYNPFLRHRRPVGRRGIPRYRTPDIEPVLPCVTHPLVRTHPESGRKLLFLGTDTEVEVVGVDPDYGQALIERLRAYVQEPRFCYPHRWQVGDILYWDNRAMLHGRDAFDASQRRMLKRISLAGTRPF